MTWTTLLAPHHATFSEGRVSGLATREATLQHLSGNAILVPLSHLGLIRFSGEESLSFLQGQLSSDIAKLDGAHAQLSSYSTPKGRMLASFLALRDGEDVLLQLYGELQATIQKRLAMFILRAKTRASDASADLPCLGLAGPAARTLLQARYGDLTLANEYTQANTTTGIRIVSLPGDAFHLFVPAEQLAETWQALTAAGALPADSWAWELQQIRTGTPWVSGKTQEEFVPQMANLELIGGVSFSKGCYPGQEIVARTQYLGKTKRRMLRVSIAAEHVEAGQSVYSPGLADQAAGMVMLAAPGESGLCEALVVARTDLQEQGLHLGQADGPLLQTLPLPYVLA
ncbi:CAF17-like 4Fe-4S cluster assembly/insertion protein YgfZ [Chitinilyticum litopenaei]|uniref:CAF17-like 4Fe-4S cluster assembly/insertion protein YgfZ n=1 Tax=Chitinilyticum litopenaei TaxID=1121276 RepID=UPI00041AB20A|nr:folate-binding protein YgfZ [Chitinilyticum litopenaei]